ncbi:hypothetical protein Rcae01_03528 [Novipirellula caenicola]|uniref:Uncharacterized protein n=1 Tax=Novipirellula caenicola TaxID=1536901 RepID=A0ABP9VSB9_9BACT
MIIDGVVRGVRGKNLQIASENLLQSSGLLASMLIKLKSDAAKNRRAIVARLSKPLACVSFGRRSCVTASRRERQRSVGSQIHRNGSSLESWPTMLCKPLTCVAVRRCLASQRRGESDSDRSDHESTETAPAWKAGRQCLPSRWRASRFGVALLHGVKARTTVVSRITNPPKRLQLGKLADNAFQAVGVRRVSDVALFHGVKARTIVIGRITNPPKRLQLGKLADNALQAVNVRRG